MIKYFIAFIVFIMTFSLAEIDHELLKTMAAYNGSKTKLSADALPQSYSGLKKALESQKNDEQNVYTVLYFFSNSVSTGSYSSFLKDLAKHNQSHDAKLSSSQCLIGVNGSLRGYLIDTREKLKASSVKEVATDLIDIRMTPEMFENYNISIVPAIALARCPQSKHPSKCTLLSIARGDVTLQYFFEQLKENGLYPQELEE